MDQELNRKEKLIYKMIMDLQKGNDFERNLAFECIGILGNESINESLENKLKIVENLINNYKKSRQ